VTLYHSLNLYKKLKNQKILIIIINTKEMNDDLIVISHTFNLFKVLLFLKILYTSYNYLILYAHILCVLYDICTHVKYIQIQS
jgi:hypothetical protein